MLGLFTGVVGIAAGLFGAKKGKDAVKDAKHAKELLATAKAIYNQTINKLEEEREETQDSLEKLGKAKLEVWDKQFNRFINLFSKVRSVEIENNLIVEDAKEYDFSEQEFLEMKKVSLKASEILTNSSKALSSGALVGIASYGGTMMLGTASTGTAISTLSGIAASNATLAWLGGGSLAAGGLGMAGGTAVLGGLVIGPALAVGGLVFSSRAKEKLAIAKLKYAEVENKVEEIKGAISMLQAIQKTSNEFDTNIQKMAKRMDLILDKLAKILQHATKRQENHLLFKLKKVFFKVLSQEVKLEYEELTLEEKKILMQSFQLAQTTKILLETPLLTQDGELKDSCKEILEEHKIIN